MLAEVETAKEAAVSAVPDRRGRARPLADALFEFEQELRAAWSLLPSWTGDEAHRAGCAAGLEESLRRAEALRLEARELTYESLVAQLAELIDPLEPFEAAANELLRA